MHEYSKFLDMLNAIKSDDSKEPVRRKKRDQKREVKIKYFTNLLKTDAHTTAECFLLQMADENLLPQIGNNFFWIHLFPQNHELQIQMWRFINDN